MQPEDWQPDRRALVRLCAAISGDPDAAEDLAQETLLEAWRNRHKLHDPAGADRWLAAIARNVCRRWARRRGRDAEHLAGGEPESLPLAGHDVEVELERAELAELLDRALALLPPTTREVLVARFIHEQPRAAIAAQLGVSEDAVSMRISRGKVVLRRILASDLRAEAAAYAALDGADDGWRETRVWCPQCGQRRLLMRRQPAPGAVTFRCSGCERVISEVASEFRLGNPFFARLLGDLARPTAILARAADWSVSYFAAPEGAVACTGCGAAVRLRTHLAPGDSHLRLVAACERCGVAVSTSAAGVALAQPQVRQLQRQHPRIRAVPQRHVEHAGVAASVLAYQDVLGSSRVDVVVAQDTLQVLHVAGSGC